MNRRGLLKLLPAGLVALLFPRALAEIRPPGVPSEITLADIESLLEVMPSPARAPFVEMARGSGLDEQMVRWLEYAEHYRSRVD